MPRPGQSGGLNLYDRIGYATDVEAEALRKLPGMTAAETARRFGWSNAPGPEDQAADWFGYSASLEAKLRESFKNNPQYQELYGLKPASMTEEEWRDKFVRSGVAPGHEYSQQAQMQGMKTGSEKQAWQEDFLNVHPMLLLMR